MKSFFDKSKRFIYFLLALTIGFGVTYGISLMGDKTKGPVGATLEKVQAVVYDMEHKFILDKRESHRKTKLAWFDTFRTDKDKLINADFVLLGASDNSTKDSYENIFNLEDALERAFPLIHIYTAWGSRPEQQFPMLEANAIFEVGSIPVITWEPWVTDFDEEQYKLPPLSQRSEKSMLSIAYGQYDLYIKQWALKAKEYGHPIYLRFGHEMNDPIRYPWGSENNTPQEYVKAWIHIHDMFAHLGVDNIIWVWSPHLAYPLIEEYYPGEQYVDVIGTTVLNYGTAVAWSQWWSFDEIFGIHYDKLEAFHKPIMLAEFGSLPEGGDRAVWFADALHDIGTKYKAVNSLVFFHYAKDKTVMSRPVNWQIKDDSELIDVVKEGLGTSFRSIK